MNEDRLAPYGAFLLRVSMGVMLLAHGLVLKVMTYTPAGTAQYFESIGYPGFFAYLVIAAEILGGLALIAGLFTRLVSLALVPVMIGATLEHAGNNWVFSAEGGGWEFPVFWTATLLAQALLGDGAYGLTRKVAGGLGGGALARTA
ncbi:MAG TPA: DoxX family protein [Azospirillaceae bacterium]|nr:DoxX family protein [Azospirillaceae bacterium]